MARPRACDACSFRKVRCTGQLPCSNCLKAGFECSFEKRPKKSGPKGPRLTTRARVDSQLQNLGKGRSTARSKTTSLSPPADFTDWNSRHLSNPPVSPPSPPYGTWKSTFPPSDMMVYLEIYRQRMYPIWPVIETTGLISALKTDENDKENCALAFAVCAGTGAQLQLKSTTQEWNELELPEDVDPISLAERFAAEAERCRSEYDYRESLTLESILVPLFLHFYYGAKGKKKTATFLLREAVSICQILAFDKEETYRGISSEEENRRRRTFWLLYVTERGHAMQHGTPICLTKSIALPSNDQENDSQVPQAFNSLVHLFASVDGVLVVSEATAKGLDQRLSMEMLVQIQHELRQRDQWPVEWNEIPRSDVSITQQWLRMLVWQLSLKNVSMSSEPGDDSMSFTYPAQVSRDALGALSTVSIDALVAHGPGMVVTPKLRKVEDRIWVRANRIYSKSKYATS
ncbi:unnamed protein product [Penicillium salamii]|nr:unnamed protein product [Penicillium salamii]CAG8171731.1 unnamed protein product [Penicillium salamii]CAG8243424.1 unnamed protein product [Penicillium salamii]